MLGRFTKNFSSRGYSTEYHVYLWGCAKSKKRQNEIPPNTAKSGAGKNFESRPRIFGAKSTMRTLVTPTSATRGFITTKECGISSKRSIGF